ncbi:MULTISPECIES: MFS transporter [Burkholderia]|uniref:MFS transporter n=1 Tax=Burkholderia TaxID=32008 RepID=UPI001588EC8E|nr:MULTISPECIES: MFS transporter [Burkholderia]
MKADVALALGASTEALHEDALYRKVILRIVPLFFLGFIMSYLDRVNIGFAKLQMAADFGLTNASFALGASVFFWGYMLFEIPSNLILRRVGARAWIARIMITWGIVSTLMIFSRNEAAFYSLRFLLGVCEAGFVPGVMYYTNTWLPVRRQSGMYSLFLMALPIAVVFGAPLSGAIMETMDGVAGVRGWQWLFLLEGLPSAVLGVVILALLRNRPADVDWLTPREKQIIEANVAKEAAFKSHRVADAFRTPKIYALIVVMILFNTAFYGLTFWMPTLFHDAGVANSLDVGLFTAIPFGVAAICMYMNAKVAERSGRLRRHGVVPVALAAVGLFVATVAHDSFWLALIMLTVATSGILSLMPIYWTLPGRVLSGAAAAAGLALINACGSLSGILGAMIIGYAGIRTGMAILAGFLLLCSVVFYRVCPPTAE